MRNVNRVSRDTHSQPVGWGPGPGTAGSQKELQACERVDGLDSGLKGGGQERGCAGSLALDGCWEQIGRVVRQIV